MRWASRSGLFSPYAGPGQAFDLQLHQPLGGKADHLAQQIGIGALFHKRAKVHHLVGHRWFLESGWCQQPDPTGESPVATAKPSARYGAIEGARADGFAPPSYTTTGDTTMIRKRQCLMFESGRAGEVLFVKRLFRLTT